VKAEGKSMPTLWIATEQIKSRFAELFVAVGWLVVPFASPDLLLNRAFQACLPDAIIFEAEGKSPEEAFRKFGRAKIAPVLIVVASWPFALQAIEAGADDVIVSPVDPAELLFRVHRLVRLAHVVHVGELTIDLAARSVHYNRRLIKLPRLEFRLLVCLAEHIGQVVEYDQMLNEVWKCDPVSGGTRYQVKNCIKRLRQKIEPDASHPQYIISVRQVGYCLKNQAQWEEPHV
jgi:DNA-binding response OmpR family regulator